MRESKLFRLGRWHCYILMQIEQAPAMGWTILAIIVALTTAGFILSPWVGLAAIAADAFILVTAFTYLVMVHGFNTITSLNIPEHRLIAGPDGLTVEFEDGKRTEVERSSLRPFKIYPGGVLIPVWGTKTGWLWVPPKAFETGEEFKAFLDTAYRGETESLSREIPDPKIEGYAQNQR